MTDKAIGDFIPERNRLGHFGVYILKHKKKDFTGLLCGIGFQNGRGSTNSWQDVQKILNLLDPKTQMKKNIATDITEEYWTAKIEARKKGTDAKKNSEKTEKKEEKSENKEA